MKKEKIIKIITIVVSFIVIIGIFVEFFEIYSYNYNIKAMVFMWWFPLLLVAIALIIYVVKSIINVIQNKVKINIIDIIILVFFIYGFVSEFIFAIVITY